ncbi:MAG TPA: hypothetical protein EYP65_06495 [Armatimonadetes bacterium]|nr:hypothetical protein [Armatimonadota bacterium]
MKGPLRDLPRPMLALFGAPGALWKLGKSPKDLGANSMVISHKVARPEVVERCVREGLKVYLDFACFAGKERAKKHPDLWPIGADGRRMEPDEWYLGLCPTKRWWREHLLERMTESARKLPISGVWLDFIRFPTRWELPNPRIKQACFCKSCLGLFREFAGIDVPVDEPAKAAREILSRHLRKWAEFKVWVVTSFVEQVRRALDEVRPGLALGCFTVPWRLREFGGAILKVLGQDFREMARFADALSPMVYHRMLGRPVDWVGEYTAYMKGKVRPRMVVPIVQAVDHPAKLTARELGRAISLAVRNGDGAIIFTLEAVAKSREKIEATRRAFLGVL